MTYTYGGTEIQGNSVKVDCNFNAHGAGGSAQQFKSNLDVTGDVTIPGEYQHAPAKTKYLNVHATQFVPFDSAITMHIQILGAVYPNSSGSSIKLLAPLKVPHNSTIKSVQCSLIDSNAGGDINIKVVSGRITDGSWANHGAINSADGPLGSPVTYHTNLNVPVDLTQRVYHLEATFNQHDGLVNLAIHSCRVGYEVTNIY